MACLPDSTADIHASKYIMIWCVEQSSNPVSIQDLCMYYNGFFMTSLSGYTGKAHHVPGHAFQLLVELGAPSAPLC